MAQPAPDEWLPEPTQAAPAAPDVWLSSASVGPLEPTWRERVGALITGDDGYYSSRGRVARALVGSSGLGREPQISASDLVPPVAALFAGNELPRARNPLEAILSAAAVIPAPGASPAVQGVRAGAATAAEQAGRTFVPAREALENLTTRTVDDAGRPVATRNLPGGGVEVRVGTPPAPAPAPADTWIPEQEALARAFEPPAPRAATVDTAPSQPVEIVTPDTSMRVMARPELVELDDLRLASGRLQPRDRSRAEYQQEARERATRLDPQMLQPGRVSDSGAPVVGPDGTVLSGNGRVLSLGEVYSDRYLVDQAAAYRRSLGPQARGMRQPVLVMRVEEMSADDAARFADLSNRPRIAQMSATERAARDANALRPEGLALYRGGDFTSRDNAEFLRAFSQNVVQASERPAFSSGAELTQEGVNRMRAAVLHGAYEDAPTIAKMLESTDDNIRNITGALTDAAPGFVQLRADIRAGHVMPEMDATPQLTEAVRLIADLRSRGVSPANYFAQQDAFNTSHPLVEAFVRSFYNDELTRAISRQKMAEVLNAYTTEARKHAAGGGLFDDPTTAADVLGVAARARGPAEQPAADLLSGGAPGVGAGVPGGGALPQGPAAYGLGTFAPAGGATLWAGGQQDSELDKRARMMAAMRSMYGE